MKLFLWLHGLAYLSFGAFIIFSRNGPIWTFAVVGTGSLIAAWYTEWTRIVRAVEQEHIDTLSGFMQTFLEGAAKEGAYEIDERLR